MTLFLFIIGLVMMAVGFVAVIKTNWLLQNFGDISELFGSNARFMSWKLVGIIFIILGFMIAFGLFGIFFRLAFGSFVNLGT